MKPEKYKILVIGATSSLAQAICRKLASAGHELVLGGRDQVELRALASDLRVRYGTTSHITITDFLDTQFSPQQLIQNLPDVSHLIIAAGDMGSGDIGSMYDIAYTTHINYTMPAQIAATAAKQFSEQNGGTIVIISSVAGDRGRGKIAAYSSAKAALTAFSSALRNAYYKHDVHVMTVKPGLTDTPMTWGMTSRLIHSREAAASKIIRAMEQKRDVVYAPWFWRYIMLIIMHIPEKIFKRLSL